MCCTCFVLHSARGSTCPARSTGLNGSAIVVPPPPHCHAHCYCSRQHEATRARSSTVPARQPVPRVCTKRGQCPLHVVVFKIWDIRESGQSAENLRFAARTSLQKIQLSCIMESAAFKSCGSLTRAKGTYWAIGRVGASQWFSRRSKTELRHNSKLDGHQTVADGSSFARRGAILFC